MKRIAIVTATRAEYGLLRNLIIKLGNIKEFNVNVLVTGTHLSKAFGETYKEIEQDGIEIYKKIPILQKEDDTAEIIGRAIEEFGKFFTQESFDAIVVLGDRYEILAVCIAAMVSKIPIIHLYGGDTTEGAIDEAIRHSITKMSYLHFTSTEIARKRVIQLGENPERVFCVGSTGVENIMSMPLLEKEELGNIIGFPLDKDYAVVTFHPVTLDEEPVGKQVKELLQAMDAHDLNYIITKANADAGGNLINTMLEEYATTHKNVCLVDSLGSKKYLSALKYAVMVIGNSSSGLSEAPSFCIPTVNIGNRQRGRVQGNTIINCSPLTDDISKAIEKAKSIETREQCRNSKNPYGDGNSTDKIVEIIARFMAGDKIDLKKQFYDVSFEKE